MVHAQRSRRPNLVTALTDRYIHGRQGAHVAQPYAYCLCTIWLQLKATTDAKRALQCYTNHG